MDLATWIMLLIFLAGAARVVGDKANGLIRTGPTSTTSSSANSPAPANQASRALAALRTVPSLEDNTGYDRSCKSGHGCSFGPAWDDNVDVPDTGHNGCDTRNDVLKAQLTAVTLRSGSGCVVISGRLADPYTGRTISFSKANASAVQIDHLYPLSRAWAGGARTWPLSRRQAFANDTAGNLLAVDGPANSAKGDKGPGQWMPVNKKFACSYATKYVAVATKYQLPVTPADRTALQVALGTC